MIKIERRTLFDIIDGYNRASSSTVNTNGNYWKYNPYLTSAQWATSQWATNNINYIDTRSYTIDAESLRRYLDVSLESDTVLATIDDRAPHIEITEQKLLEFLNGKDDSDANI